MPLLAYFRCIANRSLQVKDAETMWKVNIEAPSERERERERERENDFVAVHGHRRDVFSCQVRFSVIHSLPIFHLQTVRVVRKLRGVWLQAKVVLSPRRVPRHKQAQSLDTCTSRTSCFPIREGGVFEIPASKFWRLKSRETAIFDDGRRPCPVRPPRPTPT